MKIRHEYCQRVAENAETNEKLWKFTRISAFCWYHIDRMLLNLVETRHHL